MSHPAQPGDFALVVLEDGLYELYKVIAVSPTRIDVVSIVDPKRHNVVLPIGNTWRLAGTYDTQFSTSSFLTYIPDIDVQILNKLSDPTLAALCSVDQYIYSLCQGSLLWKLQAEKNYTEFLHGKRGDETWKHFYQDLTKIIIGGQIDVRRAIDHSRFEFLDPFEIGVPYMYYAAFTGNVDFLDWLLQHGICPDEEVIKIAVTKGYPNILKWLEQKVEGYPLPDQETANLATNGGVIEWLERHGISPNVKKTNKDNYILDWMEEQGVMLDIDAANAAAERGDTKALDWLRKRGVLPTQEAVFLAASGMRLNSIDWIIRNYPSLIPFDELARWAREEEYPEIIEWLQDKT